MNDFTNKDRQEDAFIGLVAVAMRQDVVRSLLTGNDTGCFTTEQYKQAYEGGFKERYRPTWRDGMAEMHLKSTGLVEEVTPGVWKGK